MRRVTETNSGNSEAPILNVEGDLVALGPLRRLAARGLSNRQIASSIHLAEGTVKRHMANVNEKMGTSSRGEAARKALQEGWITIEEVTEAENEGGRG